VCSICRTEGRLKKNPDIVKKGKKEKGRPSVVYKFGKLGKKQTIRKYQI